MPSLVWFDLYLPPGLELATVTNVIRPLAGRAPSVLLKQTPPVVFEVWSFAGKVRWLLGMDQRLMTTLPGQLQAQLIDLVLTKTIRLRRPLPDVVGTIHATGITQPLRVDMALAVSNGVLGVMGSLAKKEAAVVQFVVGPAWDRKAQPETFNLARSLGLRPPLPPSARERNLWRQKASEPLFAVRCQVGARAANPKRAKAILGVLGDGLQLAGASHTQLDLARPSQSRSRSQAVITPTGNRWSAVLNAAELASILGWPLDGVSVGSHRRTSAAPTPLLVPLDKEAQSAVRVLGTSLFPADASKLVTLPTATCLHHLHVTGVTGAGKSTLLANFVRADIMAGHGVLVIEPRGDLVTDVLAGVPLSRRDDVVVVEPGSTGPVVGFNPLAGPLESAERRADDVLHLFHELYPGVGPRSSDVLLHALVALARLSDGTLADLPVLLTNGHFRHRVLSEVTDPLVLAPFFAWYDGLAEAERAQVIAPVLNKTRAFLSRPAIRRLLGQASARFQLDDLFSDRRIVLVNLNTGLIGAETASLIGALLVTQLWQAIQRRATTSRSTRHPVMLVIDEVQNYLKLPVDVGDMLAQARGLGVSLTAAHQHLGQLKPHLRAAFQANARSKIALRPSADDREPLAKALGGEVKASDLEQLGPYEAYARVLIDGALSRPFAVKTRPLSPTLSKVDELRALSRQRYGVDARELDDLLQQRWQRQSDRQNGPIGVHRRRTA